MTDQQHPITPLPELVEQWWTEFERADFDTDSLVFVATQAARWGADQQLKLDAEQINEAWQKGADAELEACCEWVSAISGKYGPRLRIARRPKPPSLKEQAIAALTEEQAEMSMVNYKTIRTALDSLPS